MLLVAVVLAAWQIVVLAFIDHAGASGDRYGASSRYSQAQLARAGEQLQASDRATAAATARQVLAQAPLQGQAFVILARIAEHDGDVDRALALYRIAARRAPRDAHARAWLADRALKAGDYAAALDQIDTMYRVNPEVRDVLVSALVRYAAVPDFAEALVLALQARPTWRGRVLGALQADGDPGVAGRILGALHRRGGLEPQEVRSWLGQLMRQGRWGEAYARWAGALTLEGEVLPALYNGGFDTVPDQQETGFDWHVLRIPGVLLDFVPDPGTPGLAAHATFLGRPVAQVNLEHPLLLAPGKYRLTARMRGQDLRSNNGLEWAVTCKESGEPLARSQRINGSFTWRRMDMGFTVPGEGCDGQWLRLRNPAPTGSAQQVSGALWFDDVSIHVRDDR